MGVAGTQARYLPLLPGYSLPKSPKSPKRRFFLAKWTLQRLTAKPNPNVRSLTPHEVAFLGGGHRDLAQPTELRVTNPGHAKPRQAPAGTRVPPPATVLKVVFLAKQTSTLKPSPNNHAGGAGEQGRPVPTSLPHQRRCGIHRPAMGAIG